MNFLNKAIVSIIPFLPKSVVQIFSKKYVAGTNYKEVLNIVKKINKIGQSATIDILGEHTLNNKDCDTITNEYIKLLEEIDKNQLDCNLSIKPSHIGADIDYQIVLKNFKKIQNTSNAFNNFIRFDMESSKLTDITINLYTDLKSISDNVGIVFQAYLHRSKKDIIDLKEGSNIRLCKGIYKESEAIAIQDYDGINSNYIELLKIAFQRNIFVGIATHDESLIHSCIKLIEEMNIPSNRFEFQYLYGVPMKKIIKLYQEKKYTTRVYIPFGEDWYDYSLRRIKENPKIASYVIKNILSN